MAPDVSEVRPWSMSLATKEFWAKNSNIRKIYLENQRGRSPPAGQSGLRKQVIEAKVGPWSLEKREWGYAPRGKKGRVLYRETLNDIGYRNYRENEN